MSTITELIDRGLCRGSRDPRYLLDDPHVRLADPEILATCGRCPVREACLQYALETEEEDHEAGVWGGTTPYQRRQLMVERARVRCPACQSDAIFAAARGEVCLSCGASWLA